MEESSRLEWLCKEVGVIVYSGDKRNDDTPFVNELTNVIMSPIDVLCTYEHDFQGYMKSRWQLCYPGRVA